MKTQGMDHQLEGLRLMAGREAFALLMEQGTGKTWTCLADAERNYAAGKIDGLFILAPNGVHTNWTRREIPAHLGCEWTGGAYRSGMGMRETEALDKALFRPRGDGEVPPLRVLAMNIDAIITDAGFKLAARFVHSTRCFGVIDESSDIKNIDSARTKRVLRLRDALKVRRILNGTPITNSPGDAFAQFEFLDEGLLGTTSYRSFYAEYTELEQMDAAQLIIQGNYQMAQMLKRNPRMKYAQVAKKNADGTPRYRNLDKLQRLIAPHSYRVLKKDCLQLPEKIYSTHFIELPPPQRKEYDLVKNKARIELAEGTVTFTPIAVLTKMQQVTSGFVMVDGAAQLLPSGATPRLNALESIIEHTEGQFIVWVKFVEELRHIAERLLGMGVTYVEYHGAVKKDDREIAVDAFQSGKARCFLGQPKAGGIGITLTAAQTVIYYSNDFNLRTRLQSEDRAHRIGTKTHVRYIDIVAAETVDEAIARALQNKSAVAAEILGDTELRFSEADVQRYGAEDF